jgi:MFS transporter, AAHS family, 4-hydroxybenzoate transporter
MKENGSFSETANKTSAIDVGKLIDDSSLNPVSISVMFLCGLIMLMDGYDFTIISVAAPRIMKEWNVDTKAFGLAFSAAFLGYLFGAMICGALSDRIGRKKALILGSCIFSVGTLLVFFSNSMSSLIPIRIFTGFGIGGAVPCAITLTSEYSPSKGRGKYVSIMYSGFLLGIVLGSFVAGYMLNTIGWRPLFLIGFVAPVAVIILLWFKLPESARWLSVKYKTKEQKATVIKLLHSIKPDILIDAETQFVSTAIIKQRSSKPGLSRKIFWVWFLGPLFIIYKKLSYGRLAWVTPLIWAYYLISSLAVFFIGNWSPKLLVIKGYSDSTAAYINGLVGIGVAIACLLSGFFFDRFGFRWGSLLHAIAAVCIYFLGGLDPAAFVVLLFISGFFINSAHMDVTILAPIIYPSSCRNLGAGTAISAGRIGAMTGPYIGGVLLSTQLPMSSLLAYISVPLVLAAILCYIAGWQYDFYFAPLYAGKIAEEKTGARS